MLTYHGSNEKLIEFLGKYGDVLEAAYKDLFGDLYEETQAAEKRLLSSENFVSEPSDDIYFGLLHYPHPDKIGPDKIVHTVSFFSSEKFKSKEIEVVGWRFMLAHANFIQYALQERPIFFIPYASLIIHADNSGIQLSDSFLASLYEFFRKSNGFLIDTNLRIRKTVWEKAGLGHGYGYKKSPLVDVAELQGQNLIKASKDWQTYIAQRFSSVTEFDRFFEQFTFMKHPYPEYNLQVETAENSSPRPYPTSEQPN